MSKKTVYTVILVMITAIAVHVYLKLRPRPAYCYGYYSEGKSSLIDKEAPGMSPCVIMEFVSWNDGSFDHLNEKIVEIRETGATPILTLEPWYFPGKKPVSLNSISSGEQDKVLRSFGRTIAKSGGTVMIRFAHEMNGNWYPWAGFHNGKSPAPYIEAWKRAHKVISSETDKKATLLWIWSVNNKSVPSEAWNKPQNYYPGNEYVDIIGIDGYNWSSKHPKSFDRIFHRSLIKLRELYPTKAFAITETASSGSDAYKANWIKNMFHSLDWKYNYVSFFVWFDHNKEENWAVTDNPKSIKVFREGAIKK